MKIKMETPQPVAQLPAFTQSELKETSAQSVLGLLSNTTADVSPQGSVPMSGTERIIISVAIALIIMSSMVVLFYKKPSGSEMFPIMQ